MFDIHFIKSHRRSIMRDSYQKGCSFSVIDRAIHLHDLLSSWTHTLDTQRAAHKAASREIGVMKNDPDGRRVRIAEQKAAGETIALMEQLVALYVGELKRALHEIPNTLHSSVPRMTSRDEQFDLFFAHYEEARLAA